MQKLGVPGLTQLDCAPGRGITCKSGAAYFSLILLGLGGKFVWVGLTAREK